MSRYMKIISVLFLISIVFFFPIIQNVYAYKIEEDYPQNIIGNTQTDLIGGEINGISIGRIVETNLGDLVADALVDYTKTILKDSDYEKLPVIGIQNGGGIRKSIQKGFITRENIKEVLPYGNFLVVYDITPKELYSILENGVSRIKYKNNTLIGVDGRFSQVSGMKFIYDYSQQPSNTYEDTNSVGSRILAIYIDDLEQILDRDDTTTHIILAFNNYCMDGGDGYTMLHEPNIIYTGDTIDNIVCEYIQYNKDINYNTYGRIEIGENLGRYPEDIRIFFNSELVEFDTTPLIEDYKLLIPIRRIAEAAGVEILWDDKSQSIEMNNNNEIIKGRIGSKEIEINDVKYSIEIPLKLINNYTMVPISFIRVVLDANIEWDSNYNAAFIEIQK